jgi:hypothetical protein
LQRDRIIYTKIDFVQNYFSSAPSNGLWGFIRVLAAGGWSVAGVTGGLALGFDEAQEGPSMEDRGSPVSGEDPCDSP